MRVGDVYMIRFQNKPRRDQLIYIVVTSMKKMNRDIVQNFLLAPAQVHTLEVYHAFANISEHKKRGQVVLMAAAAAAASTKPTSSSNPKSQTTATAAPKSPGHGNLNSINIITQTKLFNYQINILQ